MGISSEQVAAHGDRAARVVCASHPLVSTMAVRLAPFLRCISALIWACFEPARGSRES
jgi:hypothetical protein